MCPICGWPEHYELPRGPAGHKSDEICSCCGFQFGWTDEDLGYTYEEWRERWIARGYPFQHSDDKKPNNWDGKAQLETLLRSSSYEEFQSYQAVTRPDGIKFWDNLTLREDAITWAVGALPLTTKDFIMIAKRCALEIEEQVRFMACGLLMKLISEEIFECYKDRRLTKSLKCEYNSETLLQIIKAFDKENDTIDDNKFYFRLSRKGHDLLHKNWPMPPTIFV